MGSLKDRLKTTPFYSWLQGGWPDDARVYVQEPILHKLASIVPPSGPCLNAGAGEGLYAHVLDCFPTANRIVHMDIVMPKISQRWNHRHEDKAGSVTELPFAAEEFDFVLLTEVIEHVQDDDRAISEVARVLKPGGRLLLSTPTPPAPADPEHVRDGYLPEQLEALLSRHGLRLLEQRFCCHVFMRALLMVWRWQFEILGRRRKSYFPRLFVHFFGWLDRTLRWGKPWDIIVLAQKQ